MVFLVFLIYCWHFSCIPYLCYLQHRVMQINHYSQMRERIFKMRRIQIAKLSQYNIIFTEIVQANHTRD